jgi:hypothetical protein
LSNSYGLALTERNIEARIALLIPCYNEELTIPKVVRDFRRALPPTLYRASSQSLDRVNAVLAHAAQCRAAHIMLATDSPTLNITLLVLAITIAPTSDTVKAGTLAYNATMGRVPIDEDFRTIRESDQVVFQDKDTLNPWWANLRASEYERYVRQNGYVPIKVASDVTVYSIRCRA